MPLVAATSAMPDPIVPAPMTAMLLTVDMPWLRFRAGHGKRGSGFSRVDSSRRASSRRLAHRHHVIQLRRFRIEVAQHVHRLGAMMVRVQATLQQHLAEGRTEQAALGVAIILLP